MSRIIILGFVLCCMATTAAYAQVNVTMPWLRGTAQGQGTTAVFMQLEAHHGGDVAMVAASSPLARSVEMRETRRSQKGSKSHPVPKLEIAAGSSLDLKPGRSHLVLVGLRRPIRRGEWIPVTLVFETRESLRFSVEIQAEAMAANAKSHWHKH